MDNIGSSFQNSQNVNAIEEAYNSLNYKNQELATAVNVLKRENYAYKKKYNVLKHRLTIVTESLQKNASVFQQLFDNTKSALQMGSASIVSSPVTESQRTIIEGKLRSDLSPIPKLAAHHRKIKIPLEPLKLAELHDELGAVDERQGPSNWLPAVIEEEIPTSTLTEAYVSLCRLPSTVVRQHLAKNGVLSENSSLNISEVSSNLNQDLSSTPKLVIMDSLGLCPIQSKLPSVSPICHVNKRKRYNIDINERGNVCANNKKANKREKENVMGLQMTESENDMTNAGKTNPPTLKNKREKEDNTRLQLTTENQTTSTSSGRLTRKAKPSTLKEESLKTKKRRL